MRQDKKTIERGVRMVKIKQIIEGKIASLDEVGNGILYSGKDRIFVRHVILNEVVRVRVVKRRIVRNHKTIRK